MRGTQARRAIRAPAAGPTSLRWAGSVPPSARSPPPTSPGSDDRARPGHSSPPAGLRVRAAPLGSVDRQRGRDRRGAEERPFEPRAPEREAGHDTGTRCEGGRRPRRFRGERRVNVRAEERQEERRHEEPGAQRDGLRQRMRARAERGGRSGQPRDRRPLRASRPARRAEGEEKQRDATGEKRDHASPRERNQRRVASTSRRICAVSSSIEGKTFSSRRRSKNVSRIGSP